MSNCTASVYQMALPIGVEENLKSMSQVWPYNVRILTNKVSARWPMFVANMVVFHPTVNGGVDMLFFSYNSWFRRRCRRRRRFQNGGGGESHTLRYTDIYNHRSLSLWWIGPAIPLVPWFRHAWQPAVDSTIAYRILNNVFPGLMKYIRMATIAPNGRPWI